MGELRNEQDVKQIFSAVLDLVSNLNTSLDAVTSVCVTGQMHGVVMWNSQKLLNGMVYSIILVSPRHGSRLENAPRDSARTLKVFSLESFG